MRASFCILAGLVVLLVGCATAERVEFTSPRVMLHVQGRITSVEVLAGQPTVEPVDGQGYRVDGTGSVHINGRHLVEITPTRIRLHGMDVDSAGAATRNVFLEEGKAINCVHPDRMGP